jgi:hypothetical protein
MTVGEVQLEPGTSLLRGLWKSARAISGGGRGKMYKSTLCCTIRIVCCTSRRYRRRFVCGRGMDSKTWLVGVKLEPGNSG